MSETNLEAVEERIEFWVGEREAIERSREALLRTLGEIDQTLDELREQADAAESAGSVEEDEEQAWLFAQAMEEDDE